MLKVMRLVAVLGLAVLAGCNDTSKSTPVGGKSPPTQQKPADMSTQKELQGKSPPTRQKPADLPTQEELQAKLKGKKREEVIAIVGKPDREAGMETEAGRMIYDRPIAKGSSRADVWFAQGVVDNVQW